MPLAPPSSRCASGLSRALSVEFPAHRAWVTGDHLPAIATPLPDVHVEIAAEVPVVPSAFLSLDQADHRKIIREPAGRVVVLPARFGFESA